MKILFVTDASPWPPTNGGAQRSNMLIRSLKQLGKTDVVLMNRFRRHRVRDTTVMETLRAEFGLIAAITPWCGDEPGRWARTRYSALSIADKHAPLLGIVKPGYSPEPYTRKRLRSILAGKPYDLIVGQYHRPCAMAGLFAYKPVILDLPDLDTDRYETRLDTPGASWLERWVARRAISQLREVVPSQLERCAHVWVTNEADLEQVGHDKASILPNIAFVDGKLSQANACEPNRESRTLLVIASLGYDVNARAIDRFVTVVWPRIQHVQPEAVLRIVGSRMTDAQRARWGAVPGVVPVGFVDDLRSEYERSLFTIVPIFEGGGTKLKVAESLLYGRTAVLAAHAQRGYEAVLRHKESVWVAADEDAFVEGCLQLLRDPALAANLAHNGSIAVREHLTFDRFSQVVADTVQAIAHNGEVVRSQSH